MSFYGNKNNDMRSQIKLNKRIYYYILKMIKNND